MEKRTKELLRRRREWLSADRVNRMKRRGVWVKGKKVAKTTSVEKRHCTRTEREKKKDVGNGVEGDS